MPKTEIKRNPETYTDAPITGTIDQLLEQGHLLRFNDLKVWHGRASFGEDWEIESFSQYRPSRNIYENALYGTLHRQDAQDFADKRARRHSEAEPSLHSIVALSDESLILEGGEVNEIILPPDVVGSPKKFARTQAWYTPDLNPAMAALLDDRNAFIELGEVQKVASDFSLDAEKLREYAAVVNAYFSLTEFPLGKNISLMLNNAEFFEVKVKGEKKQLVETAPDFIRDVMTSNHIIGSKDNMRSATLGRKVKDVIVIWDFDAVQDKEVHEKRKGQLGAAGLRGL